MTTGSREAPAAASRAALLRTLSRALSLAGLALAVNVGGGVMAGLAAAAVWSAEAFGGNRRPILAQLGCAGGAVLVWAWLLALPAGRSPVGFCAVAGAVIALASLRAWSPDLQGGRAGVTQAAAGPLLYLALESTTRSPVVVAGALATLLAVLSVPGPLWRRRNAPVSAARVDDQREAGLLVQREGPPARARAAFLWAAALNTALGAATYISLPLVAVGWGWPLGLVALPYFVLPSFRRPGNRGQPVARTALVSSLLAPGALSAAAAAATAAGRAAAVPAWLALAGTAALISYQERLVLGGGYLPLTPAAAAVIAVAGALAMVVYGTLAHLCGALLALAPFAIAALVSGLAASSVVPETR
jgi:hypothetical protein